MPGKEVRFSKRKLKQLEEAYEQAQGETFTFEGQMLVKDYAKYLIEYLRSRLAA